MSLDARVAERVGDPGTGCRHPRVHPEGVREVAAVPPAGDPDQTIAARPAPHYQPPAAVPLQHQSVQTAEGKPDLAGVGRPPSADHLVRDAGGPHGGGAGLPAHRGDGCPLRGGGEGGADGNSSTPARHQTVLPPVIAKAQSVSLPTC